MTSSNNESIRSSEKFEKFNETISEDEEYTLQKDETEHTEKVGHNNK